MGGYQGTGGTYGGWGTPTPSPTVAEPSPVQTTLPTSAYGQTIPVVYGKARLPGAYIWCAPILTVTETHVEWWDTVTTTTSAMTARLRFARPLVPNSTWAVRRIWAEGKLIYDRSTGYRAKGLKFRFYDGRSTQGRDPSQTAEEGTNNVSAHRGYLDIVFQEFNIIQTNSAPPTFEAEFIQDGGSGVDIDSFEKFFSDELDTVAAMDWDTDQFYALSNGMVRRFDIQALQEVYAIPMTLGSFIFIDHTSLTYVPEINRLIDLMAPFGGWPQYCVVIDPETGLIVASADGAGAAGGTDPVIAKCHVRIGDASLFLTTTVFAYLAIFTVTQTVVQRVFWQGGDWNGLNSIRRIAPGEITDATADVWICGDDKLVRLTLSPVGAILANVTFATLGDQALYALWHDGDVIVWTDAGNVIRLDGSTGATVWTKTYPYASGIGNAAAAHQNRLDDTFFLETATAYYFTVLDDGTTTSISKASSANLRQIYDGVNNLVIKTDFLGDPQRIRFDAAGDGTTRNLSDFLEALTEEGGFDASQVQSINVDDLIQGAVIDVTAGVRDIARATCEPYSIAIFERPGKIVYKRAATDGGFVVDATIASAGDLLDSSGQAIKAKRQNPEEFIARYGINYRDPDEVYQARPQFGEIPVLPFPVAPADDSVKANIPIIMDGDTIKTLATQKVNKLAVERHEFQFTLRAKYADIEPEDIVQFTFSNRLITARVTETTLRPDYMIDVVATEFLASAAVSISGATGRPTEPSPVGTPASRYYHLDIPLLSDGHDLSGAGLVQYHVLASAGQLYWDGATLYRKDPSTGLFAPVAQQTSNGLVGVALEVLPDWDLPYVTEFDRELTVSFISGDKTSLTSATYLEMMNGANYFAIGQSGRWEVCQVMTVTQNSDGTTTFEGLRRGRKSSEEYTGQHQAGDYVVWLSGSNVQRIDYAIANLDEDFDYKPVGFGGSVTTTATVTRTVTGEAEKIPKPSSLDANINGSDIDLSWLRRSRIGSFWVDDGGYEAPLGESMEQYIIRIKDGPAGTVLRTFTVNDATTKKYLAADITTDFGSMPAKLTFDARQVSGTGVVCPTREATIDL